MGALLPWSGLWGPFECILDAVLGSEYQLHVRPGYVCHKCYNCSFLSSILNSEAPEDRHVLPIPHQTLQPWHPTLCWGHSLRGHTASKCSCELESINIPWSSHFTEKDDEVQNRLDQCHKVNMLEFYSQFPGCLPFNTLAFSVTLEGPNIQLIRVIEQCFSNFNEHMNHLQSLLKCRF